MAKFQIPSENRVIAQPNDGKIKGNVYSTFGMDFSSNPGKINVSNRMKIVNSSNSADSGYISGFGYPVAMEFAFGKWRVAVGTDANGGRIYVNDGTATGSFSADSASSTPTTVSSTHSDLVYFNSTLYWSGYFENIMKQTSDGGAWSSAGATSAAGVGYNFLKVGPNKRLYFPASSGAIGYITTGGTVVSSGNGTITPAQSVTCVDVSRNRMWLGTVANYYGEGTVIEWDMSDQSQQPNAIHKLGTIAALAIKVINGVPYVLCSDATLKGFTGSGFKTVAQFPSFISQYLIDFYTYPDAYTIKNFIHPNGISIVNGMLRFNIRAVRKTTSKNDLFPEMPSGIWEFNPEHPEYGIYHLASFSNSQDGVNDYGQFKIERPGLLKETKQDGASMFAGAGYYTDNSTTKSALFIDDIGATLTKRGIITTPELYTGNLKDVWQEAGIIREPFFNDTDKIISKYKYKEKKNFPFQAAITWTSTTTFTSTDTDFNFIVGGEEVFVVFGKKAGTTAHISSISVSSGTYTVTIDDAIGSSSGTATVIIDNWKKIAEHTSPDELVTDIPMTGIIQPKIQYRFEIRGKDNSPEIDQILIKSAKER